MTETDPSRFAGPSSTGAQMPRPPDDVVAAARTAPSHWLSVVDPDWQVDAPPPVWALVGQWRTDEQGEVVEWVANPEHRPGSRTLGWPAPTDAVDALVQQVATGYAPVEVLLAGLRDAELTVHVDIAGAPVRGTTPDGAPVVPAYSSPEQAAGAGALKTTTRLLGELLGELPPEHDVYLNPGGATPMLLTATSLSDVALPFTGTPRSGAER